MSLRFVVILLAGALFGAGLALSGMTNPARVIGFLDVAGRWDPSLLFVMAGAVSTYALAMAIRRHLAQGRGWFGAQLPQCGVQRVDRRLIGGALLFGIGWGLGGFCPGPALASLGALRIEALVFVPAMGVGMLVARTVFSADRD